MYYLVEVPCCFIANNIRPPSTFASDGTFRWSTNSSALLCSSLRISSLSALFEPSELYLESALNINSVGNCDYFRGVHIFAVFCMSCFTSWLFVVVAIRSINEMLNYLTFIPSVSEIILFVTLVTSYGPFERLVFSQYTCTVSPGLIR